MTMSPGVRKFALTAHVTTSVGWFGAVAGFLALALAGLTSQEAQVVRGAYLAMGVTGWSPHWAPRGACSGTFGC